MDLKYSVIKSNLEDFIANGGIVEIQEEPVVENKIEEN